MEIYLIRHTAVLAAGLCYGHYDVPLAATFAAEAARVRAMLPAGPCRAFSSPARRCQDLAAAVGTEPVLDERLREMNFGSWENRLWLDLPAAETTPWMADYVALAPPGGESFDLVQRRAAAFLADLAAGAAADLEPVLVFTHGGTIRALVCHCLDIPLRNAFQLRIDFASITKLSLEYGRWALVASNSR